MRWSCIGPVYRYRRSNTARAWASELPWPGAVAHRPPSPERPPPSSSTSASARRRSPALSLWSVADYALRRRRSGSGGLQLALQRLRGRVALFGGRAQAALDHAVDPDGQALAEI